ncbi:MAG: hypothetical protein QXS24_05755 [Desulfurococcaceae archaeon]
MEKQRVMIVASIRKNNDIEWLKEIVFKHSDLWLITDKKSAEILARENILSRIPSDKLVVYAGRNPEETALRIYKVTTPDVVYVCDNYGVLKSITDFIKYAPVKTIFC